MRRLFALVAVTLALTLGILTFAVAQEATPPGDALGTPCPSPVASPIASPVASPFASPVASPAVGAECPDFGGGGPPDE